MRISKCQTISQQHYSQAARQQLSIPSDSAAAARHQRTDGRSASPSSYAIPIDAAAAAAAAQALLLQQKSFISFTASSDLKEKGRERKREKEREREIGKRLFSPLQRRPQHFGLV
jgi:hypothetical protein